MSPFLIIETIDDLISYFKFTKSLTLIEDDLDEVRFETDINKRRRLDAEVLSLIAANVGIGKMLDIGTYLGNSAARMAINSPNSSVYTVNIHPDELKEGGKLVTGAPSLEDIGIFYREKNLQNVRQIIANTRDWDVPVELNDLSLVYIDGSHDREFARNDAKLIFDRVKKGGFILWHDCSPIYRNNFEWINEVMTGIEDLIQEGLISPYVFNVKNSWIGIWQKK